MLRSLLYSVSRVVLFSFSLVSLRDSLANFSLWLPSSALLRESVGSRDYPSVRGGQPVHQGERAQDGHRGQLRFLALRFLEPSLTQRCRFGLQDRAYILYTSTQRWLAVRLDAIGALLILAVALLVAVGNSGISPSQVGLLLTYTVSLVQM